VKPHLVHETVRAELNDARSATPRRQEPRPGRRRPLEALAPEGHRRARAGLDPRAALDRRRHGFPAQQPQLRLQGQSQGSSCGHAQRPLRRTRRPERSAIVDPSGLSEPSTKAALALVEKWDKDRPILLVAQEEDEGLIKSFRNLERLVITVPSELEVNQVVWARALLISEPALEHVQGRAQ
jgi:ribosomal protein L4